MQLLTVLLFFGMWMLMALGALDWVLGHVRPAIAFRGLNCLLSLQLPLRTRPDPADQSEVFSTATCHYRVVSSHEIQFMGRNSFGRSPWILKGRVLADGATWSIEARASLLLWVWTANLIVFWLVVMWGAYVADGPVAGSILLGIGAVGYLIYRRWYQRQLLRTQEMAEEIAADLELGNDITAEGGG